MSYHVDKLGEVASIRGGKRLPIGSDFSKEVTSHPYIRARDIGNGKIEIHEPVFLDELTARRLSRYTVQPRDICVTIVGANVGDVGVVPAHLEGANLTENAVKIVANEKADQRYLKFALLSENVIRQMKVLAGGAAQPKLGIYKLETLELPIPPIETQRRIADVLSAFDDLIANSQRRIQILESMARALYREWFVNFRFPGHEKVRHVSSELGEIPERWSVQPLQHICRLTMGQSPSSEYYNDEGQGEPFHQGVTDFGDRFPTDRLFCTTDGRIAEAGDILFSVRAPVGRMNIADKRIVIGRGLSAIRHNDNFQAFLWEQMRSLFTKEDMIGNGAIFAAVTKQEMQSIRLLCPPRELVETSERLLLPLHGLIGSLVRQITNLRRTRDILLPRLLSGRLPIR